MKNSKTAVIVLCSIAIFLGASAAGMAEEWSAPPDKAGVQNPVAADASSLAAGGKVYKQECVSCHGAEGKGDGPKAQELEKPVADLNQKKIKAQSDGAFFWKISIGNKPMPSFKKLLSDEERWSVVNYLREIFKKNAQ